MFVLKVLYDVVLKTNFQLRECELLVRKLEKDADPMVFGATAFHNHPFCIYFDKKELHFITF